MTRKLRRNSLLSVVVPLLALVIVMMALAVRAQVKGQVSENSYGPSATPDVGQAALLLGHRSPPGGSNAGRAAMPRSRTKRQSVGPMDSNPPLFLPAVAYDVGGGAVSVVVADVNGKPDLVVAAWTSVAVLLGNGDGTFQAAVDVGGANGSVAVADVNGDGNLDLVVTGYTGTNYVGYVGVLLGNGDGTFQAAVTYDSGGSYPLAIAVADVNGDGKPDLIVVDCTSTGYSCGYDPGVVGILLGNGDGTFQTVVTYDSGGAYPDSVVVTDVNGDSKRDLVVAEGAGEGVGVLLGNGDGTFQPAVTYNSGGIGPSSVAVADVNGGHTPDLVVANQCSEPTCNADGLVSVLLGNGDGTFQPAVTYDSGGFEPRSVAVGNVNRDGKPDLAVANTGLDSGSVGILLGNGDGTFQPAVTYDSGGLNTTGVAFADVNGDHLRDLLVANNCTNYSCLPGSVSVLLNNTGPHSPTTTTLVSSLNPSVFGQGVLFTATVNSSSGTPTGTVVFSDGSATLGSATLVNGSASISTSALAAGSHSITAAYQESLKYSASVSAPLGQIVTPGTTTTSVVSSFNPARVSQTVTYTATVCSQYGGDATGTVAFQDGGVTIATVTLVGNQAAYATKYGVPGAHAITAVYSGDANNTGSTSSTLIEQINKAFASKTVLTTSGTPSLVGQPVTFTATVTSTHGPIPDGELVTFYDGTTTLGSVAVANATAAYTTSSLSAKTHTIKATYAGDAVFAPSTGAVKQVVNKYPTTTSLNSNPNPSNYGQTVTFTATVTPSGPYAVTGRVKFWDGTTGIGSATLNAGVAVLKKSTLAIGTHAIKAQYLSDSYNAKSTSPVVNQVVQ